MAVLCLFSAPHAICDENTSTWPGWQQRCRGLVVLSRQPGGPLLRHKPLMKRFIVIKHILMYQEQK